MPIRSGIYKKMNDNKDLGILLHVSSLPGPYGIGTMGKEAYAFVDFLSGLHLGWWQILPLVQTGFGDSPYQSAYSGSGNPYLIDLKMLQEEGLLQKRELACCRSLKNVVDYGCLFREKYAILRRAFSRFDRSAPDFCALKADDGFRGYALFMALKEAHGGASIDTWERRYKYAHRNTLAKFWRENQDEIDFWLFAQCEFLRQWTALKAYANEKGVRIIGDLPLYVAYDSADVWLHPDLFKLNADRSPEKVAGVPPDYFSATGQLWGNPVYCWKAHARDGYAWWISRMKQAFGLYDAVRLDHFRGFDRYFEIDAAEKTAQNGKWRQGPGKALFDALGSALGPLDLIAEDLGEMDEGVLRLLEETGFPRMKVIEFAFDGNPDNPHLPKNIEKNCVCYTGTHDNDTLYGYVKSLRGKNLRVFRESLETALREQSLSFPLADKKSMAEAMLLLALKSRAARKIIPAQDLLLLDGKARMNTPATLGENWKFRLKKPLSLQDVAASFLTEFRG